MTAQSASNPAQAAGGSSSPHQPPDSGRRFGLRDGLFQAVTQGAGEQYLSAYALLLHATPIHLSILSALPQLLGTWAQLVSVKISHRFPDCKSQVAWGIWGQSAAWIPIVALPLLWPQFGPWLLITGTALYFACAHFTSPAWTSLITDRLNPNERGTYFARRSQIMAVAGFLALSLGGGLLTQLERFGPHWIGFAVLFLTAGLFRSCSMLSLAEVTETPRTEPDGRRTGFRGFFRTGASNDFRQFLLFSGFMHTAVLISGPFFVMYMLQDLGLSYWEYGVWLAAAIIGQFLTLPSWGRFGDRFGNKALLVFTSLLVAVLPMLYLLSTTWLFLVAVNFFGGVVWAGLGLGLTNYVLDVVDPADRAKAVAVSGTVNAIGWATGAFIGSWMIDTIPATLRLGPVVLAHASNLPFIFFLSGVLRLIVAGTFLRTFQEPRTVERRTHRRLVWELPFLRSVRHLGHRLPKNTGD